VSELMVCTSLSRLVLLRGYERDGDRQRRENSHDSEPERGASP
jgi:hypothetical protein